jgi:hypothetical protein
MKSTNVRACVAFGLALAPALGACDEDETGNADVDLGEAVVDMGADMGGHDMGGHDMGGGDAVPDATCDPAALAAEGFGFVVEANDAEVTITEADGVYTATIDATAGGSPATAAEYAFVYIDLDASEAVAIDDFESLDDRTWDIAFKRAEIRLNSGDSGPGPWLAAAVDDTTWETVAPPGASGGAYAADAFVSETCELETFGQGDPVTAFGQWYSYDPSTHSVGVVEGRVYILYNAASHAVVKLEIQSWDNGAFGIRWAPFT